MKTRSIYPHSEDYGAWAFGDYNGPILENNRILYLTSDVTLVCYELRNSSHLSLIVSFGGIKGKYNQRVSIHVFRP